MVDVNPYSGSFAGVVVEGNTFDANSAMIKIGVAMGPNVYASLPSDSPTVAE